MFLPTLPTIHEDELFPLQNHYQDGKELSRPSTPFEEGSEGQRLLLDSLSSASLSSSRKYILHTSSTPLIRFPIQRRTIIYSYTPKSS